MVLQLVEVYGCLSDLFLAYYYITLRRIIVTMKKTLAILSLTTFTFAFAERPQLDEKARIKQHRSGARGELVEGEEDLRKIILSWPQQGDNEYEVCHNCNIDEDSGERRSASTGVIIPIPLGQECGSRPCMVMPGAPLGMNTFHLRVREDNEWSAWSKGRNFNIVDPGTIYHEEL